MTQHIKEPASKSSKGEFLYSPGVAIDEELREYLVALTESVEMKVDWLALKEATDPVDSLAVGLRMLQKYNQERKTSRALGAANVAKGEKPA